MRWLDGVLARGFVRGFAATLLLAALLISPAPPVLAGSGVWTPLGLSNYSVTAIAVDPGNASVVFAGTRGGGVFRSLDAGRVWSPGNTGLGNLFVNDLKVDPANPTIVYAGTGESAAKGDSGNGLYRSYDGGLTWGRVLAGHIAAIAISPQDSRVVYAAGAPPVYRSADRGLTWTPAFAGIANTDISGITVDPTDPNVLLAGGATEGGSGNLYRSTNAGASWSAVVRAESGQLAIADVAFVGNGGVAIAAGRDGILRSADHGATWSSVLGGQDFVSARAIPDRPTEVLVGAAAGVYRSTDGGLTFSLLGGGLGSTVYSIDVDRTSIPTVYAGTSAGVWAYTYPTAPPPIQSRSTWYFAEGSTQPPFDTWILLQNPGRVAANVLVAYQRPDGSQVFQSIVVGPTSRYSIFVNQVLPNTPFSARIDADQPVFAERSLFFRHDGTVVTGIAAPAQTWYFAEGSTQSPFHTWFLLQNPNAVTARVTLTLQKADGSLQTIIRNMPPTSRDAVFANEFVLPAAFATRVDADHPIVAERAMFLAPGGVPVGGGHGVAGVTAPSRSWNFAEGQTAPYLGRPFDSWLLLQNPNDAPVRVTFRLYEPNGNVREFIVPMEPTSRNSVYLNQIIDGSFGIGVEATGPVVAERARYFGADPYRGADATVGAPALASTWNLAEGSTQQPFSEVIAILNPLGRSTAVHVDFQLPSGAVVARDFTLGPTSKLSLDVGQIVPNSPVSARVTADSPVAVERTMFFVKNGRLGSTNTIGLAQ